MFVTPVQWFSARRGLHGPQGAFGNVCRRFGCHTWEGVLLASRGLRSGLLLNIPRCTRQLLTTGNYLAQNVRQCQVPRMRNPAGPQEGAHSNSPLRWHTKIPWTFLTLESRLQSEVTHCFLSKQLRHWCQLSPWLPLEFPSKASLCGRGRNPAHSP